MLEQKVRILSEGLARTVDRRKFLKQTGSGLFGGMIALASGHVLVGRASAKASAPLKAAIPNCVAPGPFCNLDGNGKDPNGCHGAHCFQHLHNGKVRQCRIWHCCYQTGCWTTPTGNGYWTCCDCECPGDPYITCGCAQFTEPGQPPPPLPERPVMDGAGA